MKRLFVAMVAMENAAVLVAACPLLWLSGRWHRMTGPEELRMIAWMSALAFLCSLSAVALGCTSLVTLRVMGSKGTEIGSSRKTWAILSALASAAALLISLLPTRHG